MTTDNDNRAPSVSAVNYTRSARVRFKLKGQADGSVYAGQVKIEPCRSCGLAPAPIPPVSR